jgi:YcaO-like protein with predicted kinase domain
VIEAGDFGPTPIRSPAAHARPFDETDRRLTAILDRVPVTRVYDATPLDWLGIPVWAAVTPLAKDLTVHAGKGTTPIAARVSAVMEAIERVSAESVEPARVRHTEYASLCREDPNAAIDPTLFDLPFQTSYRADRRISWIGGYDLIGGRHVWVPLDLVISPPAEGVCVGVETNGLAAGNTNTEATLHALYEVIERDAVAHERFARLYAEPGTAPPIRLTERSSLPARPAEWVARLAARGLAATIRDLTHDVGVPVFGATITDRSFPGREGRPARFEGVGCDLDPERAVTRAISEAAQSHTAVLVGARETFETGPRPARRTRARFVDQLLSPSRVEPFPARVDLEKGAHDLFERLNVVIERLKQAGFTHCVVVDLARADLRVPVVRVLVPGAAGPYGDTSRRPALRLLRTLL